MPWVLNYRFQRDEPWFTVEGNAPFEWQYVFGDLNNQISLLTSQYENISIVDEKKIVSRIGAEKCFSPYLDERFWQGAIFRPIEFGRQLAEAYFSILHPLSEFKRKKVVVVDFDNTLWSGIMAEGLVDHYWDKQELLQNLADQGILLVALSKNAKENIRWSEMSLTRNRFVELCFDWENKVDRLPEIAKNLNLAMDAFIYLDDCERQLGLVSHYYPEVCCLDAKSNISWGMLKKMLSLCNTAKTDEAKNRTRFYKNNLKRVSSIEGEKSEHSLLPLEIKVCSKELSNEEIERAEEILSRTNQFNTSGERYSRRELQSMINSRLWEVWRFRLCDKFGDMGLVGLVVVQKKISEKVIFFSNFVMSCRAMGYGLETHMLSFLADQYDSWCLIGQYIKSEKNAPCENLYQDHSFSPCGGNNWINKNPSSIPKSPFWINSETDV